jgi:hypothetical protein
MPGTMRAPEHLSRHPFGRVPVLEHDGFSLYETQAILRYLDRVLPTPALTPGDCKAAARMDQAMNVNDWYLFQGVANVIGFQRVVKPRLMGLAADEAAIEAAMPQAHAVFGELAQLLGEQSYFAGDAVSLADLPIAATGVPHPDAGMVGAGRTAGQPGRVAGANGGPAKLSGHHLGSRGRKGKSGLIETATRRSLLRSRTASGTQQPCHDLKKLLAASLEARFLAMATCSRSISDVISAMRSVSSSTDSSDRSCPISWVTFFLGLSSSSIAMRSPVARPRNIDGST